MPELITDCPRCGSKSITFDVTQAIPIGMRYSWQQWWEAFAVCRHCLRSTVFTFSQKDLDSDENLAHKGLLKLPGALNHFINVEGFVSIKDLATAPPPDHLPPTVEAAFREGAACLAFGCYNAAGTMFRLTLELATRTLLPEGEAPGLNAKVRRDLGLRLPWLFDNGYLPESLRELSTSVKEEGNDGAHAGSLQKEDADDLLDFAVALLERMFTEPERLRLAAARREERRSKASEETPNH